MSVAKRFKKFAERLQAVFSAAAYAEAGEAESAREIILEQDERETERKQAIRPELSMRKSQRITMI